MKCNPQKGYSVLTLMFYALLIGSSNSQLHLEEPQRNMLPTGYCINFFPLHICQTLFLIVDIIFSPALLSGLPSVHLHASIVFNVSCSNSFASKAEPDFMSATHSEYVESPVDI